MDIRTGKTYETVDEALLDGVPVSDIAHVECELSAVEQRLRDGLPVVKFSKGSFKSYRQNEAGELVRV
jgi:hypothetical protein